MREGEILNLEWSQADFLHGVIRLRAGETKNDEAREVPIVAQLKALLVTQQARRQPGCAYVCFKLDRKERAVQVQGFRKAWYSACIRAKLGRMVPVTDPETGEALCAKRQDRPNGKAKPKMSYEGLIFHDLRRSGARALVYAGVLEKVAMLAVEGFEFPASFRQILRRHDGIAVKNGPRFTTFRYLADY